MFSQLSLKYRIAATVCLLQAVLLVVTLHWTLSAFVRASQTHQASTEQALLTLLRPPSRHALLTEEYEDARRAFTQVRQALRVRRVLLADATNRIVLSTTSSDIGSLLPALTATTDQFWRTTDLTHTTGKLGILAIEFSTIPLRQAHRTAWHLGLRIAITGMAVIVFAGVGLGFVLTRRLGHLTRAVQRVTAGDEYVAVGLRGHDEMAQVGRAFDAMAQQIAKDRTQLQEGASRLRAILDTIVDAIITIDDQGRIESFNPAAEGIFGYTVAEVRGRNVTMLMPSPYREEHDGYLAHYRDTGERKIIGIGREVMGQRKDGTTFPMDLAVSEVSLNGGRVFTGIVRDITERKQSQEALRQARDDLERRVQERTAELAAVNEEVRRFAYIVSHDLRAPLVNLKGFANELRDACSVLQAALPTALPHLDEHQQRAITIALEQDIPEALGFIDVSVRRMDRLIQAVLTLARAGTRALYIEPVKTEELVHDIMQTLTHQLTERQAQITIGSLPEIHADRTAMEQIFGNLLSNAIKYLEPGRPGEIAITAAQHDKGTTFYVRDNGRGIAADDIPKMFELFRRVGRHDMEGEGMGLTYVQTLVRRHGGEIQCQSTLSVGTTFSFTISHHLTQGDST
jgi:PAS domain S-box-containing protein